jgi:hypothetical protein
VRNADGVCVVLQQQCPDGSPMPANGTCATTPQPCPDGSARNAFGQCPTRPANCPAGQVRGSDGVCVAMPSDNDPGTDPGTSQGPGVVNNGTAGQTEPNTVANGPVAGGSVAGGPVAGEPVVAEPNDTDPGNEDGDEGGDNGQAGATDDDPAKSNKATLLTTNSLEESFNGIGSKGKADLGKRSGNVAPADGAKGMSHTGASALSGLLATALLSVGAFLVSRRRKSPNN